MRTTFLVANISILCGDEIGSDLEIIFAHLGEELGPEKMPLGPGRGAGLVVVEESRSNVGRFLERTGMEEISDERFRFRLRSNESRSPDRSLGAPLRMLVLHLIKKKQKKSTHTFGLCVFVDHDWRQNSLWRNGCWRFRFFVIFHLGTVDNVLVLDQLSHEGDVGRNLGSALLHVLVGLMHIQSHVFHRIGYTNINPPSKHRFFIEK